MDSSGVSDRPSRDGRPCAVWPGPWLLALLPWVSGRCVPTSASARGRRASGPASAVVTLSVWPVRAGRSSRTRPPAPPPAAARCARRSGPAPPGSIGALPRPAVAATPTSARAPRPRVGPLPAPGACRPPARIAPTRRAAPRGRSASRRHRAVHCLGKRPPASPLAKRRRGRLPAHRLMPHRGARGTSPRALFPVRQGQIDRPRDPRPALSERRGRPKRLAFADKGSVSANSSPGRSSAPSPGRLVRRSCPSGSVLQAVPAGVFRFPATAPAPFAFLSWPQQMRSPNA